MFEPWPAPVTMEDEDDLEKSRVGHFVDHIEHRIPY